MFKGFRGPLAREDENVHKGGRTNGKDKCATPPSQQNSKPSVSYVPSTYCASLGLVRGSKGGPDQGVSSTNCQETQVLAESARHHASDTTCNRCVRMWTHNKRSGEPF